MLPDSPRYMELTEAFAVVWQYFTYAWTWMTLHGVHIWDKYFTFFDIAIGVAATWIIADLIPIFGDPEDEDAVYDDFESYM